MKRKAKRPAAPVNTMPPERLAPVLDYLRRYAQSWDDAREAVAIRICHAFAETTLGAGIGILGRVDNQRFGGFFVLKRHLPR